MIKISKSLSKNKRGLIFSLESLFALILCITLVTGILFSLSRISVLPKNKIQDKILANDIGLVIDGFDLIDDNNIKRIENLIDKKYCFQSNVVDQNKVLQYSYTKLGCDINPKHFQLDKRIVSHENKSMILKLKVWYDE